MRIAYVGTDLFAPCAIEVLDRGHTITRLFTRRCTRFPFPVTIADVAWRAGVHPSFAPVSLADLEQLTLDADLLVCAGYPHRLPVRPDALLPTVNVHPSPLPLGRGPAPLEWAILRGLSETAVTIHEIVERFDAGPILHQVPVPVAPQDTTLSLAFRCRAVAATALGEALDDFARLWQERRPQSTPTYCHVPTIADRTIDWSAPVEQIDRLLRAFKPGTVRACVGGRTLLVYNASCWKERHQVPAGTAVSTFGGERLVAASDGFVALRATAPLWVARAWRRLSCLPGLRRFLP